MRAVFERLDALLLGSQSRAGLTRAVSGGAGLRVLGMGLTFLAGLQLARGLGPAGYGEYGLAMSIASVLMVPTELGLPLLVMREVAFAEARGDRRLIKRLTGWSTLVASASAVAMAVGLMLAVRLGFPKVAEPTLRALNWAALLLPFVALANVFSAGLRGLHRLVAGQVAELLLRPALLSLLLAIYAIAARGSPFDPGTVMALNVAAALVSAIYAVGLFLPRLRATPRMQDHSPAAERHAGPGYWFRSALALAFGEGTRVVMGNSAIIVLGLASTPQEVGLYKVAVGIYVVAALPQALLSQTCSPAIAKLYIEGRLSVLDEMNRWFLVFLLGSGVLCLAPFLAAGGPIVDLVFGRAYHHALAVILILLGGQLVSTLFGQPVVLLNTVRQEKAVTALSVAALVINVAGCVILAPRVGATGAAIAAAGSELIWRSSCWAYARARLRIDTSILAFLPHRLASPDRRPILADGGHRDG